MPLSWALYQAVFCCFCHKFPAASSRLLSHIQPQLLAGGRGFENHSLASAALLVLLLVAPWHLNPAWLHKQTQWSGSRIHLYLPERNLCHNTTEFPRESGWVKFLPSEFLLHQKLPGWADLFPAAASNATSCSLRAVSASFTHFGNLRYSCRSQEVLWCGTCP